MGGDIEIAGTLLEKYDIGRDSQAMELLADGIQLVRDGAISP